MSYSESIIIRDSGGTEADVTASNALKVDNSAVTQPISSSDLTAIKTAVEIIDNFISGTKGLVTEDNSAGILATLGAVADASVAAGATGSLSAKLRRATQGLEDLKSLIVLAAGTNNIGDVDVLTLPADPLGANADAIVAAGATGSISAKLRRISQGLEDLKAGITALPSHAVTNAGTFPVQVDGNALTALQLIDDTVFADDAAFTVGTSKVNAVGFLADESSTDSVDEGDIGAARITLDRKQIAALYAHTAGGYTPYKLISGATTNATSLKGSAGQIGYLMITNVNAAVRYLKLYNKATSPTVGSDTPVHTFAIPGATTGGGFILNIPNGIEFTTGIAFALTTGVADADTGAVAANEILINIGYK